MSRNASATNERQLRKRNDQLKRDRINDEIVTKNLMSTPDGRRWVYRMLEFCQLNVVTPNLDPQHMAWEKGHRNVGIRLQKDVSSFTPTEYIQMTLEAKSIELQQEPEDERSTDDPDA